MVFHRSWISGWVFLDNPSGLWILFFRIFALFFHRSWILGFFGILQEIFDAFFGIFPVVLGLVFQDILGVFPGFQDGCFGIFPVL